MMSRIVLDWFMMVLETGAKSAPRIEADID
jgi:hypothetical protein